MMKQGKENHNDDITMIIFFLGVFMINSHSYFKTAFLAINWKTLITHWKFETRKSKLVFLVLTLKQLENSQSSTDLFLYEKTISN